MSPAPVLAVEHLGKHFPIHRGVMRRLVGQVKAVDDVSFTAEAGECFSIVGESGCGKTTLARCILRLVRADAGRVTLHAEGTSLDVLGSRERDLLLLRRQAQIVFQDPFSSLDPRMTLFDIVAEPLQAQRMPRRTLAERVAEVLSDVGLGADYAGRYPHELSGGQRQRVGVARALAVRPSLVVLDEPVSALDVSVRAQILNLLLVLQRKMALTYVFISHDLSVVKHISDRVGVMYLGQLVEVGPTHRVFQKPAHPYTEALLAAIPVADPSRPRDRFILEGDVPSSIDPPTGCRFSTRCRYVQDVCRREMPELRELPTGRLVRCHFAEDLDLAGGDVIALGDARPPAGIVTGSTSHP